MIRRTQPDGKPALRCLTVTSLFPRTGQPTLGIFVLQRLQALARRGADVRVLSPVPYVPPGPVPGRYAALRSVSRADEIGGLPVVYPRYPMLPKIGMNTQAWGYAHGVEGAVREALRTWHPHVLDAHYLYPDACAVGRVARRVGLPYVCTARGSDVKVLARFPRVRAQIQAALDGAAAVIAVSHDLAAEMRALGLTDRPIEVIRNGVDGARFRPRPRAAARRELGLPEHAKLVVCVSHLVAVKRHALLVRGLAHADAPPDLHLYLIGGGAEQGNVESLVRSLGLESRAHFVGAVPPDRIPTWFNAADASVLLTDSAGCPNVVLESLACGTPCLGSDIPEMREVMPTSRQGVLVALSPDDVARGLAEITSRAWPAEDLSATLRTWDDVADELHACLAGAARPATAVLA